MAFLVFLFVTPLIAGLLSTTDFYIELFWTDLIHQNPKSPDLECYRDAWHLAFIRFIDGDIPRWCSDAGRAVLSAASVLIWGKLSAASFTVITVVCAIIFVHGCYVGAEWSATDDDWRQVSPPWSTLIGGVSLLTASLFCGRWAFERSGVGVSMTVL